MRSIKESSDELNPTVATTTASAFPARTVQRKRTPLDYLALAIATCGIGFIPVAPGTWGSALGVILYLLLRATFIWGFVVRTHLGGHDVNYQQVEILRTTLMLGIVIGITLAGIWAATHAEKLLGRKDPRVVVVDEVAGQFIAFLFVPLEMKLNWWVIIAGFLLFRLFDIWKPYPIRRLEALRSGLGVMADDLLAGAYAAATLLLLLTLVSYWKL